MAKSGFSRDTLTPIVVIGLFIILVSAATQLLVHRLGYYAHVVVEVQDKVRLEFIEYSRPSLEQCLAAANSTADIVVATCPACRIAIQQCTSKLEPAQARLLSEEPVPTPTSRLPNGVVAFGSAQEKLALAACRESERISNASRTYRAICYPPNSPRPFSDKQQAFDSWDTAITFLILALGALASLSTTYLIVRYENFHGRWSYDLTATGPHKFHARPTPRIGGVSILLGLLVAGIGLLANGPDFPGEEFGLLLLASLPAFGGGIAEDVTKKIGVPSRLLLTMCSAAVGAWLLGAALTRLDVPGVDTLLRWVPLSVAFTMFAVGGVANAVNIIDGYNGLTAGYAIVVLAALASVSVQVGDPFLVTSALAMLGALLGFLPWNYPKGKIFLGDGGAYLLGFWLAELSVLLVVRHPEVSPWFPLLLMVYPIFETLFSIYRKQFLRGYSPGRPDGLHLHMLIYKRLVRFSVGSKKSPDIMRRNSLVSAYVWALSAMCALPALLFWRETAWLIDLSAGFCVCYVWLYRRIMRWRTPGLLIVRPAIHPPQQLGPKF